jgi:hypothetical protein
MIEMPECFQTFQQTLQQTFFELSVELLVPLEIFGREFGVNISDIVEVSFVLPHKQFLESEHLEFVFGDFDLPSLADLLEIDCLQRSGSHEHLSQRSEGSDGYFDVRRFRENEERVYFFDLTKAKITCSSGWDSIFWRVSLMKDNCWLGGMVSMAFLSVLCS